MRNKLKSRLKGRADTGATSAYSQLAARAPYRPNNHYECSNSAPALLLCSITCCANIEQAQFSAGMDTAPLKWLNRRNSASLRCFGWCLGTWKKKKETPATSNFQRPCQCGAVGGGTYPYALAHPTGAAAPRKGGRRRRRRAPSPGLRRFDACPT